MESKAILRATNGLPTSTAAPKVQQNGLSSEEVVHRETLINKYFFTDRTAKRLLKKLPAKTYKHAYDLCVRADGFVDPAHKYKKQVLVDDDLKGCGVTKEHFFGRKWFNSLTHINAFKFLILQRQVTPAKALEMLDWYDEQNVKVLVEIVEEFLSRISRIPTWPKDERVVPYFCAVMELVFERNYRLFRAVNIVKELGAEKSLELSLNSLGQHQLHAYAWTYRHDVRVSDLQKKFFNTGAHVRLFRRKILGDKEQPKAALDEMKGLTKFHIRLFLDDVLRTKGITLRMLRGLPLIHSTPQMVRELLPKTKDVFDALIQAEINALGEKTVSDVADKNAARAPSVTNSVAKR